MSSWHIETSADFDGSLSKLDKPVARKIVAYLEDVIALEDPRQRGKGLTAELRGYWRYRIGDYRVIAKINDDHLIVIALDVAHRSRIYD